MKEYKGRVPACGVFCGGCPIYVREKKPCLGAEINSLRCENCKTFHLCCQEKGITHCFNCEIFPCAKFKSFTKRWLKYGQDFIENQKLLQSIGEVKFIEYFNFKVEEENIKENQMEELDKYTFDAQIYKTGINWCVDVPMEVTDQLICKKGKIDIKGEINGFSFIKTLIPVKNKPFRLFVNQAMMKGGNTALNETASFIIEQDTERVVVEYEIPNLLIVYLNKYQLMPDFENLSISKKRNILKYLSYIKTEETLLANINKLILQLQNKEKNVRIP
ncbi:DUF3795 domain-containing protein [Dysgonomonas sp. HGC4]|uniref:DUF3795 domain-containing protein n=1 Tax=Dysgonomonas sp. HGC4 TaxID=1658009 RepID=UPI0009E2807A|nr:DUF3795 domain-containing protein [Dysgonomonas sp. HGC4]MBD8347666.1 DUF1905 domain-containing protein [Dysgonomonas sp. HGC4]